MPASMMSADTGCKAYVVGSSIAIVATGPIPGSTPISVPSSTPISAYIRLMGCSATPKPSMRWLTRSMGDRSVRQFGPDRQLQLQADDEDADRQRRQQYPGNDCFLGAELMARGARHHNQHDRGNGKPHFRHDEPEDHDAAEHDDRRPPFPRRHAFAFLA